MKRSIYLKSVFLLGLLLACSVGCDNHDTEGLPLATLTKNGEVFIDGFSSGLDYAAFGDSKLTAFDVDSDVKYKGSASMRFDVPNANDPEGAYVGGVFRDLSGRDLSGYDALTFWVKGSQSGTINEIGFGNSFIELNHVTTLRNLSISTAWQKVTIPIPDPAKLTAEKGMFWVAEGPENGNGYTFWIDEVKFEKLGTLAHPQPKILDGADNVEQTFIGSVNTLNGLTQTFNLANGINQTVSAAPGYFNFTSSDSSVATVNDAGVVTVIGEGTTVISATLGGVEAQGSLTITSLGVFTAAPTPTRDASSVISIFSNAYTNVPVEYYNGYYAPYQTTQGQADIHINGDDIIKYTQLNFVGTQFSQPTVNATPMTHFHVDIQVQEAISPSDYIKIQLGDFGANAVFGGGDDTNGTVTYTGSTFSTGNWVSIDAPLASFPGLTNRAHLAQILFISDGTISNILVDNMYFYSVPTTPTVAAPTPTLPAANVISVFSDSYVNVASDLNPNWGQATVVTQTPIAGNNTLKYTGLNYQGLQLNSSLNVSGMTFLHIDYYTANSSVLNAYLISTGPVEKAKALSVPTTSGWNSIEIPLTFFSPVNLADIIQFKFDGNGTIFLDNIYFHN